jgi:hypothetical protein
MGLRFQRRVKILPGVRLNFSRSGVGLSVGGRGAHVGITARGQRYTSVGLPGTGVSWREYQKPAPIALRGGRPGCELCGPGHVHVHGGCALVFLAGLVVWALWLLSRT